jgi:hypothetical protein
MQSGLKKYNRKTITEGWEKLKALKNLKMTISNVTELLHNKKPINEKTSERE